MILTHDQIIDAQKAGGIVIEPFDEKQIQAASYDLRVGPQGVTTSTKKIVNLERAGFVLLEPGDFGIVTCFESIKLGPQYVGRFGLRSRYAREGLIATTGPQIDPGFRGRLIVGLTNLTPRAVSLPYKDDFLTVEFHQLEQATTHPYNGPYQDRMDLGADEIKFVTQTEGMALSEVLTTLGSLASNVGALTAQVKLLLWSVPAIVGLGITVIGIIVALRH